MVSGDPVIKSSTDCWCCQEVSTICERIGNFLNIMVSGDPVVKVALTVGVAREKDLDKEVFYHL